MRARRWPAHIGGEKVFVDYRRSAQHEAVRRRDGASNYTYAEVCPGESLTHCQISGLHTNLFRFLGDVANFVVCDNLEAAVTNPDLYDPGLNRTYAGMTSHYGKLLQRAEAAKGQGEGRSCPPDRAALDCGAAAQSTVFSLAELNAARYAPWW
ncbi:hypothetical protein ACVWWI_006484 [Bradyrhizobium sp. USDA 3686]|nr:hypothetical protein [Bradyrhizobium canariense]